MNDETSVRECSGGADAGRAGRSPGSSGTSAEPDGLLLARPQYLPEPVRRLLETWGVGVNWLTCPNPRCAELNPKDRLHCTHCGAQLTTRREPKP